MRALPLPRGVPRHIRALSKYCPVAKPVRVEVVHRMRWWADCSVDRLGYRIRLSARLDLDSVDETLAHEWAHAMAWGASRIDHGEAWAVAFSRCYRVVVEGWRPKRAAPAATARPRSSRRGSSR